MLRPRAHEWEGVFLVDDEALQIPPDDLAVHTSGHKARTIWQPCRSRNRVVVLAQSQHSARIDLAKRDINIRGYKQPLVVW